MDVHWFHLERQDSQYQKLDPAAGKTLVRCWNHSTGRLSFVEGANFLPPALDIVRRRHQQSGRTPNVGFLIDSLYLEISPRGSFMLLAVRLVLFLCLPIFLGAVLSAQSITVSQPTIWAAKPDIAAFERI